MDHGENKQRAHELIDRMPSSQVGAMVIFLEAMLDPFARTLANAPYDDEPVSEEEERDVAAARAAIARGEFTPHEEILAEFGVTSEELLRMSDAELEAHAAAK